MDTKIAVPIWPTPLTNVPCCGTCQSFHDTITPECGMLVWNDIGNEYYGKDGDRRVPRHYICGDFKPVYPGDFNQKTRKWESAHPVYPWKYYAEYIQPPDWVRS